MPNANSLINSTTPIKKLKRWSFPGFPSYNEIFLNIEAHFRKYPQKLLLYLLYVFMWSRDTFGLNQPRLFHSGFFPFLVFPHKPINHLGTFSVCSTSTFQGSDTIIPTSNNCLLALIKNNHLFPKAIPNLWLTHVHDL